MSAQRKTFSGLELLGVDPTKESLERRFHDGWSRRMDEDRATIHAELLASNVGFPNDLSQADANRLIGTIIGTAFATIRSGLHKEASQSALDGIANEDRDMAVYQQALNVLLALSNTAYFDRAAPN